MGPAVWSGLGRSLVYIPPILNNGEDHTIIMILSRAFEQLRNEMISIASHPIGNYDVERLCASGTAEPFHRMLAEEYGVAVTETNTVLTGWSICLLGAAVPTVGPISPATHQRPPSPARPHYGAASGSMAAPPFGAGSRSPPVSAYGAAPGASITFPVGGGSRSSTAPSHGAGSFAPAVPLYRETTGPSANPPCPSGTEYYAPEEGPSRGDGHGYTLRSRGYW